MAQQVLSILGPGRQTQFDLLDQAYRAPGKAQLEVVNVKRAGLDGNDNQIQAREPLSCIERIWGARIGSREEDVALLAMNFLEHAIQDQPFFKNFENFRVVVWLSDVLRSEPTFERYNGVLKILWENNIARSEELERKLTAAEARVGELQHALNERIDFHFPPRNPPVGLNWAAIEKDTPPNLTIICKDGEKVATLKAIVKSTAGFETRALNDELNLEAFDKGIVVYALDVIKQGGFASNRFSIQDLTNLYKLASIFGHPELIEHTANELLKAINVEHDLVKFVTSLEKYIELFNPNKGIDRQFRNILLDYLAFHLGAILALKGEESLNSSRIGLEENVQFGVDVERSLVRKIPIDLFYDLLNHEQVRVDSEDKMLAALISWALGQVGLKPADIYAAPLKGYPILLNCIRYECLSQDAKAIFNAMCRDSKYPQTSEQQEVFARAQARGQRTSLQAGELSHAGGGAETAFTTTPVPSSPGTPRSGTPSSGVPSEPTRGPGSDGPPAAADHCSPDGLGGAAVSPLTRSSSPSSDGSTVRVVIPIPSTT